MNPLDNYIICPCCDLKIKAHILHMRKFDDLYFFDCCYDNNSYNHDFNITWNCRKNYIINYLYSQFFNKKEYYLDGDSHQTELYTMREVLVSVNYVPLIIENHKSNIKDIFNRLIKLIPFS